MYIYLIKAGDFLSLTKQQLGLVIHTPPFFFFRMTKSLQIKSWIFHIRIKRKEKSEMDLPSFILPKLTSVKWTKSSFLFIHPLNWKNTTLFSLIVVLTTYGCYLPRTHFAVWPKKGILIPLDTLNNRRPIGASFKKKKKKKGSLQP